MKNKCVYFLQKFLLKTSVLIGVFVFAATWLAAQDYLKELPVDGAGRIEFVEILEFDSLSKDELFAKSLEWFVSSYASANDVIQMKDKEDGKIIGKGVHSYFVEGDITNTEYLMNHTLSIFQKDGKIRISMYGLVISYTYSGIEVEKPYEEIFSTLYKKNGKPYKVPNLHKDEVLSFWSATLQSIQNSIGSKVSDW